MGVVMSEKQRPKVGLKVVDAPKTEAVVTAPPILIASTHTQSIIAAETAARC
jgi:hypothetical protein